MPVLEAPAMSPTITVVKQFREFPKAEARYDDGIQKSLDRLAMLDLPAEDGIPLESNWHRLQMNLLLETIHYHWHDRNDYFAAGNMFIYFNIVQAEEMSQKRQTAYRGPDVFVVKEVDGRYDRDKWVVWEEGGRYPNVIVELASPSTIDIDLRDKKILYEKTFHTQEYFCYDHSRHRLSGWTHEGRRYLSLAPNDQGWLWSEEMGLWLGFWEGTFQRLETRWIRWYDRNHLLIPTLAEAEAEHARQEAQRAEQEAQRAEQEAQRAEQEAQRANAAEAEIQRLRVLLQEHGIVDQQA